MMHFSRILEKSNYTNVFRGMQLHKILEPVLGWPSKKESKTRILVKPLEPRLPRLHVSLKWKKHACGSGGVSIIT